MTIPRGDTCLFQAARRGDPWTRVNGIKQSSAVCIALSVLLPALASIELENAGGISDAAFDAAEQALLETIEQLRDSKGWVEGCLAMVCIGRTTRVYEYSETEGLCDPRANTG